MNDKNTYNLTIFQAFCIAIACFSIQYFGNTLFRNWVTNKVFFTETITRTWVVGIVAPTTLIFVTALLVYFFKIKKSTLKWYSDSLKWIVAGLILVLSIQNIITWLFPIDSLFDMVDSYQQIPIWALLLGPILISPICEELIFRGILLEGLTKKYGITSAILFSAFLFGIGHLTGEMVQIINAFFGGILLGWIYWKSNSIWTVIIIHIINNAIGMAMIKYFTNIS